MEAAAVDKYTGPQHLVRRRLEVRMIMLAHLLQSCPGRKPLALDAMKRADFLLDGGGKSRAMVKRSNLVELDILIRDTLARVLGQQHLSVWRRRDFHGKLLPEHRVLDFGMKMCREANAYFIEHPLESARPVDIGAPLDAIDPFSLAERLGKDIRDFKEAPRKKYIRNKAVKVGCLARLCLLGENWMEEVWVVVDTGPTSESGGICTGRPCAHLFLPVFRTLKFHVHNILELRDAASVKEAAEAPAPLDPHAMVQSALEESHGPVDAKAAALFATLSMSLEGYEATTMVCQTVSPHSFYPEVVETVACCFVDSTRKALEPVT